MARRLVAQPDEVVAARGRPEQRVEEAHDARAVDDALHRLAAHRIGLRQLGLGEQVLAACDDLVAVEQAADEEVAVALAGGRGGRPSGADSFRRPKSVEAASRAAGPRLSMTAMPTPYLSLGLCSVTLRACSIEEWSRWRPAAGLECIEWGADVHVPPGDLDAARRARDATERGRGCGWRRTGPTGAARATSGRCWRARGSWARRACGSGPATRLAPRRPPRAAATVGGRGARGGGRARPTRSSRSSSTAARSPTTSTPRSRSSPTRACRATGSRRRTCPTTRRSRGCAPRARARRARLLVVARQHAVAAARAGGVVAGGLRGVHAPATRCSSSCPETIRR